MRISELTLQIQNNHPKLAAVVSLVNKSNFKLLFDLDHHYCQRILFNDLYLKVNTAKTSL